MIRRVAALTFCLSCCEGRVRACIWRRSASGTVHNGARRVACLGLVARAAVGVGGLAVYMTQNGGRGAIAQFQPSSSTRGVGCRSSSPLVWPLRPLGRYLGCVRVCVLLFRRVVEHPFPMGSI